MVKDSASSRLSGMGIEIPRAVRKGQTASDQTVPDSLNKIILLDTREKVFYYKYTYTGYMYIKKG